MSSAEKLAGKLRRIKQNAEGFEVCCRALGETPSALLELSDDELAKRLETIRDLYTSQYAARLSYLQRNETNLRDRINNTQTRIHAGQDSTNYRDISDGLFHSRSAPLTTTFHTALPSQNISQFMKDLPEVWEANKNNMTRDSNYAYTDSRNGFSSNPYSSRRSSSGQFFTLNSNSGSGHWQMSGSGREQWQMANSRPGQGSMADGSPGRWPVVSSAPRQGHVPGSGPGQWQLFGPGQEQSGILPHIQLPGDSLPESAPFVMGGPIVKDQVGNENLFYTKFPVIMPDGNGGMKRGVVMSMYLP